MSDVTAPPSALARTLPVAAGGNAIAQVLNPPPRLPQLAITGAVIRAEVIGDDGHGRLLLQSDVGRLTLLTGHRLPPGTLVSLQLRPIGGQVHVLLLADQGRAAERSAARSPQGAAPLPLGEPPSPPAGTTPTVPAAAGSLAAAGLLSGRWPALETLLRPLLATAASTRGPGLAAAVPQPGYRLAAAWARLLAAYAAGDARGWLAALAPEGETEAPALARDFARLAALAREPDAEGWRYLGLPLLLGERVELHWLRLRGGRGAGAEADPGTRFLLDLAFSALGPLQLDGLLHAPRFDLVLRSHRPLALALREELQQVHREAASLAGLHGLLRFQADRAWHPLPPPPGLGVEGSVVV